MCNCRKSKNQLSPAAVQSKAAVVNNLPRKRRTSAPREVIAEPLSSPEPVEIEGETLADKCLTLGYMLGFEQPVSENVLIAAVEEPAYARILLAAVNKPERLNDLLNNPPRVQGKEPVNTYTATKLLTKASSALMKWALNGFPTVSKAVLRAREDACLACPNLTAAAHALQQLSASSSSSATPGKRTGNKTCAACGCVVTNKIRLATESCPVADEAQPGMNRWGETLILTA
jgi:hypothetical protein